MGNTARKRRCSDLPVGMDYDSDDESWRSKKVVTVLRWDGTTMEFAREFKLSKLLKDFPGFSVCKADELGSVGNAKLLSPETPLKRRQTYLLLPRTQQHQEPERKAGALPRKVNPLMSPLLSSEEKEEGESAPESNEAPQTIRILMTKKQLAKMIGDGSLLLSGSSAANDLRNMSGQLIQDPGLWYSSMKLFNHPQIEQDNSAFPSIKRKWSPELTTIVEVASQYS